MAIVSGIVVFVCVWWVVIFCVLPIGLSTQYEQQDENAMPGSPATLDIKKKFLITTIVSIVIWCVIYALIAFEVFSFRDWVNTSV